MSWRVNAIVRRIKFWLLRRRIERLIDDHRRVVLKMVGLVARTNPTLAGVTYKRIREIMVVPLDDDRLLDDLSGRIRLTIQMARVASRTEARRLAR